MKRILTLFIVLVIFMFIAMADVYTYDNVENFTIHYIKGVSQTTAQIVSLPAHGKQIGINVTLLSSGAKLTVSFPSMNSAITIVKQGQYYINLSIIPFHLHYK